MPRGSVVLLLIQSLLCLRPALSRLAHGTQLNLAILVQALDTGEFHLPLSSSL
jgi:hypothetical protein